jgi:hypothetical protein
VIWKVLAELMVLEGRLLGNGTDVASPAVYNYSWSDHCVECVAWARESAVYILLDKRIQQDRVLYWIRHVKVSRKIEG